MKSFDTELAKYAQKVRLKAAERRELRERVLTYMEYHPLPKTQKKLPESIVSQSFVRISFNTFYTRIAAGVFAVVLLVGVPLAAEQSVPGDVLYPIKTNINEGIRAQFATSPYQKVAFETDIINRRIAEAQLLAKEGKLTSNVESQIAEDVKTHADAAQQNIADLKATNADEGAIAEITYGSALDVQSAVLDTTSSSTGSIAGVVKDAKAAADAIKGTTTPSYDHIMTRVNEETKRAYDLFQNIQNTATADEHDSIERRLDDITRAVEDAQGLGDSEHGKAITELVKALSLTQKLIAFMTDINVRDNVKLDTLVPVVQTTEERTALAEQKLSDIEATWAVVQQRIASTTDPDLRSKLDPGAADLTELINTATSSLTAKDLDAAEDALDAAHDLLHDLDALTSTTATDTGNNTPNSTPPTDATGERNGDATETATTTASRSENNVSTTEASSTDTSMITDIGLGG